MKYNGNMVKSKKFINLVIRSCLQHYFFFPSTHKFYEDERVP